MRFNIIQVKDLLKVIFAKTIKKKKHAHPAQNTLIQHHDKVLSSKLTFLEPN